MASRRRRFDALLARLRRQDLRLRFAEARRRIDAAGASMEHRMRLLATQSRGRLDPLVAHLTQLSPLKILDRGYAIVADQHGKIVKAVGQAPVGSDVEIRLAQGRLTAEVTNAE